ncbi:MAG: sensor domain-containing phosphodiesterase [Agathobacter sp.]|nr:sensor domain-containing phosphodiesterase [Agathobacter sp.]
MDENKFWEKDADKISAMLNICDHLSSDSYVWVTNLKMNRTWCSEKTRDLFGLSERYFTDFEQMIVEYVYPYDQDEYLDGIDKFSRGEELGIEELCVRMKDTEGRYSLYCIRADLVRDEDNTPEYMVVVLKNENVYPQIDALTNLFSEARYVKDLEKIIARGERFAVLQIHVEGFSTFNLVYGRDFANELLSAIALKFIYMMDPDRAVYRLERERFVFIMRKAGRDEMSAFEQQVRQALGDGIMADGTLHPLKMGAGAILLEDYHGDTSSVCGQVTYALNHSIKYHQGQLVIFNDEVKTSRGVDFELMKVIHQSVHNNCDGFYLEYQPIVDSATGTVVGAEALLRWCREPYGKVPPGMFIEWMETDPSMYELGNFVLRRALTEMKPVLDIRPDFFVNVNVSIRQLERTEFCRDVSAILKDTGFPGNHLCLELTERCRDIPLELLNSEVLYFQSCGIRVAMDDYGTGSASSSIVMNVPMDEIKIDMSFIRGIMENQKNQAMVHSILEFAGQTNMATCLEGVENQELQDYLRGYNATWFQGYYYSKPISVQALEEMLASE